MLFEEPIERFADLLKVGEREADVQPFEKQLYDMELIIRQLMELKNNASSEEKYIAYESEANKYLAGLEAAISQENIQEAILKLELLHEESREEAEKEGTS